MPSRRRTSSVPPSADEPRLLLERAVELVDGKAVLAQDVEERARVDGARACRHGHALERAEPHRRVDRAAVEHGCHRASSTEVADDESRRPHALGGPGHGETVEAVAADAPLVAPAGGDGVRARLGRNGRVECRVEDGDVRDARERPSSLVDGADRGRIVERGERGQLPDRLLDPGIEHDRLAESCATVHDAVPDRVDSGRHRVEAPTGSERSSPSTTDSLRLVEPALTTRMRSRTARSSRARQGGRRRARASMRAPRADGPPSPGADGRPRGPGPGLGRSRP